MSAASQVFVAEEGFTPPGPDIFELPPVFDDSILFTKPDLLLVLGAVLVFGFFYVSARKAAMVPSRTQYLGETAYGFVRNGIARDVIGSQDFMRFVPLLVSMFFFILVNNWFGVVPFIQFPSFSRVGFAYALAGMVWVIYNGVGISKHGFFGYLKHQTLPPGVTGPILLLIVPLEFMSNILVRPITLSLRLFANMFAGHMLLVLFTLGGEYLIFESDVIGYIPVGILAFIMAIAISFLEILVQFLQAYVFTLLTAVYIQGALAEEH